MTDAEPTRVGANASRRYKATRTRTVVVIVSVGATNSLLGGWFLMLAVGVAHGAWVHHLPTIGYWWAVLLALLISRVTPGVSVKRTGS